MTPVEEHIYDFVKDAVDAAEEGDVLFGVQVNDTVYRSIEAESAIIMLDCESSFSPTSGAEDVEEFDVDVSLAVVSLVKGDDLSDRETARASALRISVAIAKLFFDSPSMDGRVTDSRVLKCARDWTTINSAPYALTNLPLIVNESGGRFDA